jgi:hypothetical protein
MQLDQLIEKRIELNSEVINKNLLVLEETWEKFEPTQMDLFTTTFANLKILEPVRLNLLDFESEITILEMPFIKANVSLESYLELAKTNAKCEVSALSTEILNIMIEKDLMAEIIPLSFTIKHVESRSNVVEYLSILVIVEDKLETNDVRDLERVSVELDERVDILTTVLKNGIASIETAYQYEFLLLLE